MLDRFNVLDRIISVSAANDNNDNFGGVKWRRKNNVFTKLRDSAKGSIVEEEV
jgi:hypothetical protein